MKTNEGGSTAKRKSPLEWKLQGRISTAMKERMERVVEFEGIEETEFVRWSIASLLDSIEKNPMFYIWVQGEYERKRNGKNQESS